MADDSLLDTKYFIDGKVYNCPFCNRRHVSYVVTGVLSFDWTDSKTCYAIFVRCHSCGKRSMHLTFGDITWYERTSNSAGFKAVDIDEAIFYSVPSSFHVIDERIPRVLRELLAEAEGCRKSNFLTGASACARKLIYELAVKVGAEGDNYDDRIKSLKAKLPAIDPTYFDALLAIQQATSSKVHEQSHDGWESKHLRLILATLHEVLQEIFVVPKVREEKRKAIQGLKADVLDPKTKQPEEPPVKKSEKE